MNAMMQQTLTIGTAHAASLPGWQAAGKTGTSQDFRDAWFIGYTGSLVAGVWLGNDDSTPMKKTTGGGLPVEIWSNFMRNALQGVAAVDLPAAQSPGLFSGFLNGFASSSRDDGAAAVAGCAAIGAASRRAAQGLDGFLAARQGARAALTLSDAARREPARRAKRSITPAPCTPSTATAPASGHALSPSMCPTIAPHSAAPLCCTKPSNDDAAPALRL